MNSPLSPSLPTCTSQARKKRYTKLQDERQALSRKRSGRKTDNERKKKSHHRAKH